MTESVDMEAAAAVALAMEVAENGLAAGEMPVGAVVLAGDQVLARACTQERALRRRLVHAELLALNEADDRLGFGRSNEPLTLAVTLEPCLMCLGAALNLGVRRVWYGLESPSDGAVQLLETWSPPTDQSFVTKPSEIIGGLHRDAIKEQFARYAAGSGPAAMRAWCRDLALL